MQVGDRVVCIKTRTSSDGVAYIYKGRIYTILNEWICGCGDRNFNVGLSNVLKSGCDVCLVMTKIQGITWIDSRCFWPIQYNSATEKLANVEIIEEKSDIPIKEPQKEKA